MLEAATAAPSDVIEATPESVGQPRKYARTLDEYKKMFSEYRSASEQNRTQVLIDYDYYDGKQLTPDERITLRDRGQPDIVINRFKVAINGILGVTARTHTDPKTWPRTPNDENSSDVATDVLRYAVEHNRFKFEKTMSMKDYLVGGTCAMLIGVTKDLDIRLQTIRWEEFFVDPRSRRPDCKDARYMGIAKWMYPDEVPGLSERDREGEGSDGAGGAPGMIDESFEDRPINEGWLDSRSKRILTVELYHQVKGVWYCCLFYYGGIIKEGPSEYLDDKGKPCNPIEAQSCYVDRDNNRYGHARDMRDLQDEINKRRSKLLHLANSSQIQARDPSAIEVDAYTARLEAAKPDGVLPYGWERVNLTDMSQAQMYLLTESKSEMERFGPNPAVLGRQGADSSGRALMARQQAGMIELGVIFDQFEDWELRVYKQIWARCKQYWKAPQYLRITDDQDDPTFVGINQPKGKPVIGPDGQPVMDPETGTPQEGDPEFYPEQFPDSIPTSSGEIPHPYGGQPHPKAGESVFGYKNMLAEMDVDITIDSAPETANIMAEQLKDLIQVISANQHYAEQVPFEVLLEMTPMPRKRQFLGKIKKYKEEQQKAQGEQQQMQMKVAMGEAMAKIKQILSVARLNEAKMREAEAAADLAVAQSAETLASAHLTAAEAHATAVGLALDAQDQVHSQAMDQQQMALDQQQAQQPDPGQGA